MGLWQSYSRISLLSKIFIAMVLGAIVGAIFGPQTAFLSPFGQVFLNLLRMAALPLIVVNLIAGIASLSDPKIFGRIGFKIMVYYTLTTAVAMVAGVVTGLFFKPGAGFVLKEGAKVTVAKVPSFGETIMNLLPSNIFKALSDGRFDQIIVFSLFVGISILFLAKDDREYLASLFDRLTKLFSKLIGIVMIYAPIGIFALMAVTVGKYGSMLAGFLAKYLAATYISVAIMVGLYTVLVYIFTRMTPVDFLRKAMPVMITSFSTSSSMASIPVNLTCADTMKIPRSISSFTIPLGAQVNKDGNGIMLALAFLFAAQAAGVEVTLPVLVKMIFIGLILTTGAGGVPGSGIVTVAILVDAFGLPLEVVGIIAGIFGLIDMGLTMINCLGDLAGTRIIAESERDEVFDVPANENE
jgi:Na+/H+-dicarboxylate symporter